jgi:NAD-dependent dihydropyrimidine dehydrogenase PreA subunit
MQQKEENRTMRHVKIDAEKCTNCRECVEVCPQEVYEMVNGFPAHVHNDRCVECDLCVNICPEDAIMVME